MLIPDLVRRFLVPALLVLAGSSGCAADPPVAERESPYANETIWRRAVPARLRHRAAFSFVTPDPALPKALIIGDSISISYTAEVRQRLEGYATVYRVPENSRSSAHALEHIDYYLGDMDWDVVVFNWGIHDITHVDASGKPAPPPMGKKMVSQGQYRENLRTLVQRIRQSGATLIWVATTPVGDYAKGNRFNSDVVTYNRLAADVMQENDIRLVDLYSEAWPDHRKLQTDGVHFARAGRRLLADAVADAVMETVRN